MNGVVLECGCGWSASEFGDREVLGINVCVKHAHEMMPAMGAARDKLIGVALDSELRKGGILSKSEKKANR